MVPYRVKALQRRRGLQLLQKGIELIKMRRISLRVNLPDKGFAGPNGTQQRVFTAHKIQIASPQQGVEVGLRQQWQV